MAEYLDLARKWSAEIAVDANYVVGSRITIIAAPICLAIGWILLLKGLIAVLR